MKTVLPLVGLLLCPVASIAVDTAAPPRPYFAANCFNCHGTEGKAVSAIPTIAGRDKAYLEEALKAFKAGTKQATIMTQLAKGYTDEELAILADYFARQR